MKKLWLIHKDEEAVSPVIATILMVAITVVLAAVLYVMVSGLLGGGGGTVRSMGVNIGKTSDGTKWELTLSSVPSGLATTSTTMTIFKADGSLNLTATQLNLLSYTANGAKYEGNADTTIDVGERILLLTSWYGNGAKIQIQDSGGILFSGLLR